GATSGNVGDTVCVDVLGDNLDIVSFQHGITWDSTQLEFVGVTNLNLKEMTERNFGVPGSGNNIPGSLIFIWTDILGVTLTEESVLFSVCFRIKTEETRQVLIQPSSQRIINQVIEADLTNYPFPIRHYGSVFCNFGEGSIETPALHVDTMLTPGCTAPSGAIGISTGEDVPASITWTYRDTSILDTNYLDQLGSGLYDVTVQGDNGLISRSQILLFNPDSTHMSQISINCGRDTNGLISVNRSEVVGTDRFRPVEYSTNGGAFSKLFTVKVSPNDLIYQTVRNSAGCTYFTEAIDPTEVCGVLTGPDTVQMALPNIALGAIGDTFTVPVLLDPSDQLETMTLNLAWDTTKVTLLEESLSPMQASAEIIRTADNLQLNAGLNVDLVDTSSVFTLITLAFEAKAFFETTQVELQGIARTSNASEQEQVPLNNRGGSVSYALWPGDTDLNGVVDQFDLFNLGFGFGRTGAARDSTDTTWSAQKRTASWGTKSPLDGIDFSFADINGDGTIDADDAQIIEQNWSNQSEVTIRSAVDWRSADGPSLFLDIDTLVQGSTIHVPVFFGTADQPVQDLFNLAFSIQFE
ncbi:MAG: hypothetical protein AAF242_19480, partial [Bacteroidota bacterium]